MIQFNNQQNFVMNRDQIGLNDKKLLSVYPETMPITKSDIFLIHPQIPEIGFPIFDSLQLEDEEIVMKSTNNGEGIDKKSDKLQLNISDRGPRLKRASPESSSTTTMFCQIIDLLKFINFKKIVKDLNADRYIKGISNWAHLITMLFVQISGASSLRDGINGLACEGGALSHLGIQSIPSKSGLSYANATRNPELFEKVFQQLYSILAPRIPKSDLNIFKFKNKLFSIDSTLIALCMELFDWAYYKTSKGAVKIHLVLEHNSYLPYYALVSEGKVADIHAAEVMPFPKKSILVMDRGYVKLTFFDYLDENECFFVTRLKDNLQYKVVSSLPLSNPVGRPRKKPDTTVDSSKPRITADQRIIFTGPGSYEKYPKEIRLVTALVPNLRDKKGELYEMKFLTNNFNLSAATISAIYRNRWMVESFFQAIKQNLRIKTFLGTSKNAVKIQIFSALIAMLLITYLKGASTTEWSLSGMLYLIRQNIHMYKNLYFFIEYAKNRTKNEKKFKKESFVPPGSPGRLF